MSEIRVDKIEPAIVGGSVRLTGITTFSGSSSTIFFPIGTADDRPSNPSLGEIRILQGDTGGTVEYYNGISWVFL